MPLITSAQQKNSNGLDLAGFVEKEVNLIVELEIRAKANNRKLILKPFEPSHDYGGVCVGVDSIEHPEFAILFSPPAVAGDGAFLWLRTRDIKVVNSYFLLKDAYLNSFQPGYGYAQSGKNWVSWSGLHDEWIHKFNFLYPEPQKKIKEKSSASDDTPCANLSPKPQSSGHSDGFTFL